MKAIIRKDLFSNLSANFEVKIQVLDHETPVNLANYRFELGTTLEEDRPNIDLFSSDDPEFSIIDHTLSVIKFNFVPSVLKGYKLKQCLYQIKMIEISTGNIDVLLEGRLFTDFSAIQ